jgi:hypothetical protein
VCRHEGVGSWYGNGPVRRRYSVGDGPSAVRLSGNNLVELLETAKYALEPDREAAKASLVTASSILRSEIERLRALRAPDQAHERRGRQRACALSSTRICAAKSTRRGGKAKPISLGPSKSLRRNTARLRGEQTAGEGVSSDDDHSATLREIALTVSVFPIKHIFAGASDRRLVKVHPDGDKTLSADKDYPM